MITTRRNRPRVATPVEQRDIIDTWKDGYVDSKTADRIGKTGLRSTVNQILKQDGTLTERPSTVLYGVQPVGTVLGEIVEFTKRTIGTVNVTENYELSIQNVSGTARAYYRKDGSSWTAVLGKTYSTTARAHLCPIRDVDANYNDEDKVLILNGSDNLSYLDINTLTIVPFITLSAPVTPSVSVGAGVTGTSFPNRYRITAGNRGETAATSVATGTNTTSKMRSEWSAATENITVTITRVTNATRYHIYYGTESGQEVYLTSVDDPGTGTTFTWVDTGVIDPNIFRPAPSSDTTAGPIGTRASFINGQVFITGDKANPKYVRYGGTGLSILDFSPYGGGGYEPVGGNKEVPVKVAAFRSNGGSPAITVLCKGTNGFGKRYIFTPSTIAGSNVSYFAVSEENGNDGTEAPDSVILAKDQLWYLSRDGVKTTLTKAQVQTILSTDEVSDAIENFIKRLNTVSLEYAVGLTWENRLYWAVAAGSTTNNQIICLDLSNLRKGAWMLPWTVAADWMWLYNDNSGVTHFCILSGNQVLEFTDNVATQDNGVAFPTSTNFGIQKASKDGKEWIDMRQVTFVFNNLDGAVTVGITGKTEDDPLAILGSQTFISASPVAGWGEAAWGDMSWGDTTTVPSIDSEERQEIVIEVGEELNWWEPSFSTTDANVRYELLEIIPEFTNIGIKE
jgi:hypothetical protein